MPALYALAGLTGNEETFVTKSGVLPLAARHGLAIVAPDTSPRGAGIAGEDADWDLGTGAGFYLDATAAPWSAHYRMGSHVAYELPGWVEAHFPIEPAPSRHHRALDGRPWCPDARLDQSDALEIGLRPRTDRQSIGRALG